MLCIRVAVQTTYVYLVSMYLSTFVVASVFFFNSSPTTPAFGSQCGLHTCTLFQCSCLRLRFSRRCFFFFSSPTVTHLNLCSLGHIVHALLSGRSTDYIRVLSLHVSMYLSTFVVASFFFRSSPTTTFKSSLFWPHCACFAFKSQYRLHTCT